MSRVAYCDTLPGEDQQYNIVSVTLNRPFDFDRLKRNFYATSSCGVCGKAALDDIEVRCAPVATGTTVDATTLLGLPDALRKAQKVFERTGGLHAAGLFSADGRVVSVGRTSAATTRWTRSWGSRSWPGGSRSPTTCSR